jgi:hypothetical protein
MINLKKSGRCNNLRKAIKKEDPQADLTGSKTGTVGTKLVLLIELANFFNTLFTSICLSIT